MELCRYVSFKRFCEMLFSQELTLIKPEKWNDKYENYLLQIVNRQDGLTEFKAELMAASGFSAEIVDNMVEFAKRLCSISLCLCFSMSIDSEVMWNAYNDNNETIMWKTTDRKLESISRDFDLRIVRYDLEEIGFRAFLELFSLYNDHTSIINAYEFFIHKRSMFSYEDELRVVDISTENKDLEVRAYPIPSLKDFIDGVMVHPLASARYVSMVEQICHYFDIQFLGKSRIYELDNIY